MKEKEVWVIEKDNLNIEDIYWNCQGDDKSHYIKLVDKDDNAIIIRGWKAIHAFIESLFEDDPIPRRKLKSLALSGDTFFSDDIKDFIKESKTKKFLMYGKKLSHKTIVDKEIQILSVDNVTTHSPLIDDFFIDALMEQTKEVILNSKYEYPFSIKIKHDEILTTGPAQKPMKKLIPTITIIIDSTHKLMIRLYKKKIDIITQLRILTNDSPSGHYNLRPPKIIIRGEHLSYGQFVPCVRRCVDYILDATFRLKMVDHRFACKKYKLVCTSSKELTESEIADLELDNYRKFNKFLGELQI